MFKVEFTDDAERGAGTLVVLAADAVPGTASVTLAERGAPPLVRFSLSAAGLRSLGRAAVALADQVDEEHPASGRARGA